MLGILRNHGSTLLLAMVGPPCAKSADLRSGSRSDLLDSLEKLLGYFSFQQTSKKEARFINIQYACIIRFHDVSKMLASFHDIFQMLATSCFCINKYFKTMKKKISLTGEKNHRLKKRFSVGQYNECRKIP